VKDDRVVILVKDDRVVILEKDDRVCYVGKKKIIGLLVWRDIIEFVMCRENVGEDKGKG
jgi:hypothetical protein